ncbi:hypothetical protein L1987_52825 [Smallanthus sonchifolius]|uniref:Uncharacterized protein n=1 Tax=Smallanthus sonchifolius TaxID=185202 RepID=A0ACB9EUU8_9ASTR|nr:hypothetical protein L1987_52825 [Smallanthus sonchifolius]
MDHLPRSGSRHHPPPAGKQPPATSPPFTTTSSNKSHTFTKSRSISTTRTINYKEPEVNPMTTNTTVTSPAAKKKAAQDGGIKNLPRKKPTSPSAWALSPGRVAPCPSPVAVQPPTPGGRSRTTGGGISGVLNSGLQMLELKPPCPPLKRWQRCSCSRIEAKNFEAVGRVVRKLTAASVNIPMVHDSKGDVSVVCDLLDTATMLLASIESMITKLSYQAEKSCYLLTELSIIAKQEHESLAELQTWMNVVALLKVTN